MTLKHDSLHCLCLLGLPLATLLTFKLTLLMTHSRRLTLLTLAPLMAWAYISWCRLMFRSHGLLMVCLLMLMASSRQTGRSGEGAHLGRRSALTHQFITTHDAHHQHVLPPRWHLIHSHTMTLLKRTAHLDRMTHGLLMNLIDNISFTA